MQFAIVAKIGEERGENSKKSGNQKELPKKGCEFYSRVTRNSSHKDLTDWWQSGPFAHCALKF